MSTSGRILIVDDELAIRRLLRNTLQVHGYEVLEAGSVTEALAACAAGALDVMILDLGLPDGDGLKVVTDVRAKSDLPDDVSGDLPIIVLSARGDDAGKIAALDAGADDYVTKPFSVEEMMARIRAAMRHRLQRHGSQPLFVRGELQVDLVRRVVTRAGAEVRLSPKEYGILQELVTHAGRVLTHRHLLTAVWGKGNVEDVAYLRVYIRQLRAKLEADPEQPMLIVTEPGVGYRLRD